MPSSSSECGPLNSNKLQGRQLLASEKSADDRRSRSVNLYGFCMRAANNRICVSWRAAFNRVAWRGFFLGGFFWVFS